MELIQENKLSLLDIAYLNELQNVINYYNYYDKIYIEYFNSIYNN